MVHHSFRFSKPYFPVSELNYTKTLITDRVCFKISSQFNTFSPRISSELGKYLTYIVLRGGEKSVIVWYSYIHILVHHYSSIHLIYYLKSIHSSSVFNNFFQQNKKHYAVIIEVQHRNCWQKMPDSSLKAPSLTFCPSQCFNVESFNAFHWKSGLKNRLWEFAPSSSEKRNSQST